MTTTERGIIEADSIELAMIKIASSGQILLELRTAQPEELEIERLKKRRDSFNSPAPKHTEYKESKLPYMILLFVVVILLIIYACGGHYE